MTDAGTLHGRHNSMFHFIFFNYCILNLQTKSGYQDRFYFECLSPSSIVVFAYNKRHFKRYTTLYDKLYLIIIIHYITTIKGYIILTLFLISHIVI